MSKLIEWVRPIFTTDYAVVEPEVVSGTQDRSRIDHFEDGHSNTGYRLMAKARMTFAGLRTKNQSIYLPDEMFEGMRSFVHPFPKPILPHHGDNVDPIGRVVDIRYVDTTHEVVKKDARVAGPLKVFRDKTASKKTKVGTAGLFLDLENTQDNYTGVGHLLGLWELVDPEAIQKTLDRRYLSVSTSFVPRGAYCSTCAAEGELVDWRREDCDHQQGKVYDDKICVAVPWGFEYDHVAPVNDPAAPYAMILESGDGLTFSDAVKKNSPKVGEIFSDLVLVKGDKGLRISDKVEITPLFTLDDKKTHGKPSSVIETSEPAEPLTSQENKMLLKLSDLTKDPVANYDAIAKLLPEGTPRLTSEFLKDLPDELFAGPRRTFLAKDLAHVQAGLALLDEVEDSDGKQTLLEFLETKLRELNPPPVESVNVIGEEEAAVLPTPEEDQVVAVDAATETATVTLEALREFETKVAELEELKDSHETLKKHNQTLKRQLESVESSYNQVCKDYKTTVATILVDKMIEKGYRIADKRTDKLSEVSGRSLQAILDSIRDLDDKGSNGLANEPVITAPVVEVLETNRATDRERYAAIFDRYYDIKYGPGGDAAANTYWRDQQRRGYIPPNVNP